MMYGINTNNYVETWHRLLKREYIRYMRRQRVDVLVYILTNEVEPDFCRDDLRVALELANPSLCQIERKNKQRAQAILLEDIDGMLTPIEDRDVPDKVGVF